MAPLPYTTINIQMQDSLKESNLRILFPTHINFVLACVFFTFSHKKFSHNYIDLNFNYPYRSNKQFKIPSKKKKKSKLVTHNRSTFLNLNIHK
ncbi:hypothetical protein HanHA300_Chr03g0106141 [Helianthus annuus]|nr:hypothetical protein HanHA300_Chr03g0106141 [Helianthus annuus]KAJ0609251.1 hypothetical protein HanHA89_Chr03g0117851 [Helianthus annuus]